jgi:peroxiredoxin
VLIHDHLGTIAEHFTDRNVAMALNMGEQLPMPYRERLLRALHDRGRDRQTRGRMGLALGRYLKAEADFIERLTRPGAENRPRMDVVLLDPAFVERLRKTDHDAIVRRAEEVLRRVIADYGDVVYVNGMLTTKETLAVAAERELAEIQNLSVGKTAPEIIGEDVDGKPMKLSEFRGKVVLLDFGSHEHCNACVLVYPRMRSTLDRLHGRPFVILGINNHDRRDSLQQAIARGEITWRCWWDGDKADTAGPIATSWNIRGYPTFVLIDHRGVIRSRADLHPLEVPSFENAIEALLKEAEAAGRRH